MTRARECHPSRLVATLVTVALVLVGLVVGVAPAAIASAPPPTGAVYTYDSLASVAHGARADHAAVGLAARSAPRGSVVRSQGLLGLIDGFGAAAETDTGLVNLASDARTTHILEGDATGGGHRWPGLPGKSPFPEGWSGPRIMHEISDIATDPAAWENATIQGGRTVLTGVRGGVDIRVIVNSRTGDIITGYPTNLLRNP